MLAFERAYGARFIYVEAVELPALQASPLWPWLVGRYGIVQAGMIRRDGQPWIVHVVLERQRGVGADRLGAYPVREAASYALSTGTVPFYVVEPE